MKLNGIKQVRGGWDARDKLTIADFHEAIACTTPPHVVTSISFSDFIYLISISATPALCDMIRDAGVLPVLFDMLRRWPTTEKLLQPACAALFYLSKNGSYSFQSSMRDIPDCEAVLRSTAASGVGEPGEIAVVLDNLGLLSAGDALVRHRTRCTVVHV